MAEEQSVEISKNVCLVVDDEPAILRILSVALEEIGCEVIAVEDARSALEVVRSRHLHVAIVDIQLPDINGLDLVKQIRDFGIEIPIILISAYGEPAEHTAEHFIPKPFDVSRLARTVDDVVKRYYGSSGEP